MLLLYRDNSAANERAPTLSLMPARSNEFSFPASAITQPGEHFLAETEHRLRIIVSDHRIISRALHQRANLR